MSGALSSFDGKAPINQLDDREPRWFAVYTRYKREKLVHQRLRERGIETYLPLQKVTRHYTRKVKHLELPLLSCYLFTKITNKGYVPVLEDPDVVKFVRIARDLIAIPEEQIDMLRRIVGEGEEVAVETGDYRIGDAVEVIGGRLTGLRGRLIDKEGEKFFVVDLEFIDTRLRMKIDPKYLGKAGSGSRKAEGGSRKAEATVGTPAGRSCFGRQRPVAANLPDGNCGCFDFLHVCG